MRSVLHRVAVFKVYTWWQQILKLRQLVPVLETNRILNFLILTRIFTYSILDKLFIKIHVDI